MQNEITVSIDGVEVGTAENVKFQEEIDRRIVTKLIGKSKEKKLPKRYLKGWDKKY